MQRNVLKLRREKYKLIFLLRTFLPKNLQKRQPRFYWFLLNSVYFSNDNILNITQF